VRREGKTRAAGLAVLTLGALALLLAASPALAAKKYVPVTQFPPPYPENLEWSPTGFENLLAQGIAISNKNSHIYVADSGRGVVFDFSSTTDKVADRWEGGATPAGSFGGSRVSVAVDNGTGDVYVADRTHGVIDKFDEGGNLITSFGDSEPAHDGQLAGLATPAGSFTPPTDYYSSFAIAINQATHNLYVVDAGHKVIDIFDESGAYLEQITATPAGLYEEVSGSTRTTGIAVTTVGDVYVADWAAHEIFQFNAAGEYVSAWNGGTLPNGAASKTPEGNFGPEYEPLEVAAEDSTGNVFVNNPSNASIDVFDKNGNYLYQTSHAEQGGEWILFPEVVAIDQATGYLYSARFGSNAQVFEPIIVPDVSAGAASDVGTTTATFHGHVDPASAEGGGPITECHFEYLATFDAATNGASELFKGAKSVPCTPGPAYTTPTDVSATVTGLTPGTEYRVRLVASNSAGENSAIGENAATVGRYNFSTRFGSSGSGDGQLDEPLDVAINESNGDVYVADAGNHRVDQFSPAGSFIRAFGADVGGAGVDACTSGCQAGSASSEPEPGELADPKFVEVDNSTGPSAGDVYVADGENRTVQKFDSSGNLLSDWGSGGAVEFSKTEGKIGGITVDDLGNLFVLTVSPPYNWTEFSENGLSITKFPTNGTWINGLRMNLGTPGGSGIDIGMGETWYETQPSGRGSAGVLYSSTTAPNYASYQLYFSFLSELVLANSGLAVDRSSNNVFVDQSGRIDEFPAANCNPGGTGPNPAPGGCWPSDSFGAGDLTEGAGLAAPSSSHLVYAADSAADAVAVFAPLPAPEVETKGATGVGPTAATLTGHVDPSGPGQVSDCRFEYLAGPINNEVQKLEFDGALEGTFTLTFEGQTTGPIALAPGGFPEYYVRTALEALPKIGNENVKVTGQEGGPFEIEFIKRFAQVNVPQLTVDPSQLTPSGASAAVTTSFPGNGWQYGTSIPCSPPAPLSVPTDVSAELNGLSPFTVYHYRLVAARSDSEGLDSYGKELTFTPGATSPPGVGGTGASAVTPTSAQLHAEVNPMSAPTTYLFDYGPTSQYGQQTPASESIGEDETDHTVSTQLSGLTPGAVYHFRAVAINLNGVTNGPDQIFATPDHPEIGQSTVAAVSANGATLSLAITPGFRPTTYRVEYGVTRGYGASTPQSSSIGADNSPHLLSADISGLAAATTYHYRVVASNEIGTTSGPDQTFTTTPSSVLPAPAAPRAPKCKRKFVLRHGRCVKKPNRHHRHRRHKRRHHHG
jgi:sugar lactone lactonase YvrE